MTSRELVIKTLNHEAVPRVARDLWLPADEDAIPADELAEIGVRYPSDIVDSRIGFFPRQAAPGQAWQVRTIWVDAWGCVWHQAGQQRPDRIEALSLGRCRPNCFVRTARRPCSIGHDSPGQASLPRRRADSWLPGSMFARSTGCVCFAARGGHWSTCRGDEGHSRPLARAARRGPARN